MKISACATPILAFFQTLFPDPRLLQEVEDIKVTEQLIIAVWQI